jgi:predicted transcriptional regulator
MRRTRDGRKIIARMIRGDAELHGMVADETINARIAQSIYDARKRAGLTQKDLAEMVGTKQPVIARLEDADYHGHSLSMLQRIAEALNLRLNVELATRD